MARSDEKKQREGNHMTAVDILAGALSTAAQSGEPLPVIVGAFLVSFCVPAALLILHTWPGRR